MYYAEYCKYGINISYESLNGNAFEFYAFDSKKERDEFVENHEWDYYPNRCAAAISRKAMESVIGKGFFFVLSHHDDVRFKCVSNDTPVFF